MVIRKCNDNIREELEGTDIAALKKMLSRRTAGLLVKNVATSTYKLLC